MLIFRIVIMLQTIWSNCQIYKHVEEKLIIRKFGPIFNFNMLLAMLDCGRYEKKNDLIQLGTWTWPTSHQSEILHSLIFLGIQNRRFPLLLSLIFRFSLCIVSSILDVDECDQGTHTCDINAGCTNTVGSYTCGCNVGYRGDGRTCNGMVNID